MLSRRIFLIAGGGAGLVLGLSRCGMNSAGPAGTAESARLNAWIAVAPDDSVTLRVVTTDIGQGSQTGAAQIIADELDADWSKIRVEMAPVIDSFMVHDKGYYTGGSESISEMFDLYAQAGATARAMLVNAAAMAWKADVAHCTARDGMVFHPDGKRKLSFGSLAERAARLTVPTGVQLKTAEQRRYIGRALPRLDIPDKVRGRAMYGIDVRVPGMLVATLAQNPFFGGTLESVDEKPALAVPGVSHVVKLENAVVVIAGNFWTAKKGLAALSPRWMKPANAIASEEALYAGLAGEIGAADSDHATAALHGGVMTAEGREQDKKATEARVAHAFARAAKIVDRTYRLQILSHSPIEPMNATAHVTPVGCELWASMQAQDSMRTDLAAALKMPEHAIVLHTTKVGGGFGRRLQSDYGVLAAKVSQRIGKPVKLLWTREEDMTHDFYRPASIGRIRAALDDKQRLLALDYVGATSNDTAFGGLSPNYFVDIAMRQKRATYPLPIGAWRSVDASITVFFLESLIDEIAHEVGIDPLAYRRMLLAGHARELRVLEAAADMAGWGRAPAGRFHGLAFFTSTRWRTTVAQIVEVSLGAASKVTVHKICCAVDPGLAVNPNQVRAQMEGGITIGLSAALGEVISLKDGRVEQTNFDSYQILRLAGSPDIDVRLLETEGAPPGGCGEPPVPPIAAALANALFAATGRRIRELPVSKSGFTV